MAASKTSVALNFLFAICACFWFFLPNICDYNCFPGFAYVMSSYSQLMSWLFHFSNVPSVYLTFVALLIINVYIRFGSTAIIAIDLLIPDCNACSFRFKLRSACYSWQSSLSGFHTVVGRSYLQSPLGPVYLIQSHHRMQDIRLL